jgi:hypothetical protein
MIGRAIPSAPDHLSPIASLALIVVVLSETASAQTRRSDASDRAAQRGWASLGVGTGTHHLGDGGTLRLAGAYAVGPFLGMVRRSLTLESLDYSASNDETSYLIGAWSRGANFSESAAVGLASVHWANTCYTVDDCQSGDERGVAWDLGVHASRTYAGLAFHLFGVAGPPSTRLIAGAISLELGWFGR